MTSERNGSGPREESIRSERDRLSLLLEVTNLLMTRLDLGDLFEAFSSCLSRVVPHEYASVTLLEKDGSPAGTVRLSVLDGRRQPELENRRIPITGVVDPRVMVGQPSLYTIEGLLEGNPIVGTVLAPLGLRRFLTVPLNTRRGRIGILSIATRRDEEFLPEFVQLVGQVAVQVALAIDNGLAYEEIRLLTKRLALEKNYLEEDWRTDHNFSDIIGQSQALRSVLRQVETVAGTTATVLITGETGTGKELVARAIHDRSDRRGRSFVRVNCAAIPSALVESEMFGHERGAFTGAVAARVGRFEVADSGTLFLDEVGDLAVEVQPKLLRAIQEQEFERVGGNRTIRVNTRVIAATNRDLLAMVADNTFRQDLYYRLNVFPLHMPPLRERREDIPALVSHLVRKHAQKLRRTITAVPASTMEAFQAAEWPGNIRELENVVERAVILATDGVLRVPPFRPKELTAVAVPPLSQPPASRLDQIEREAIIEALRVADGTIGGPSGAAARLGIKRTTLQSRMRKLGIKRPNY